MVQNGVSPLRAMNNNRNPSVPCASLPDADLKAWMEAPGMMMPNNIGINRKR